MRLGILQTGEVNETLVETFGTYPGMFEDLFWRADPTISFAVWPVMDGDFPESPGDRDAWIVTGSKHGVYEDLPWIAPLKNFLRDARETDVPLIGVCFGHQIIAEAFGGRAVKAPQGWCAGVQRYDIRHRPTWLREAPARFRMHAMHQDQVTELPADATVLAASAFNPFAMLAYGDPERPDAISIQPHPEFDHDYTRALIDMREVELTPALAEAARASLTGMVDSAEFARWALAFLDVRAAATAA